MDTSQVAAKNDIIHSKEVFLGREKERELKRRRQRREKRLKKRKRQAIKKAHRSQESEKPKEE